LDDIASQTAKTLPQTAGILIDDAATIPQYVNDTAAKRELPVVWKIAKKSLRNKALMIPVAILITYFAPWLMAPILVLGGSYLAFEGSESLGEKLGLIQEHEHSHEHSIPDTDDLAAAEDATVNSAVRTDTILSIEIIALTISSVVNEPITTQIGVLILIGLIATIGVYGTVGLIIKMDDVGLHLRKKYPTSKIHVFVAKLLILGMPKVMKALGWIGVIAMLMVGGGILIHNIPFLHGLSNLGASLPLILSALTEYFVTPIIVALIIGVIMLLLKKLYFLYRY
jgi:predicted DNA repair protein MutK